MKTARDQGNLFADRNGQTALSRRNGSKVKSKYRTESRCCEDAARRGPGNALKNVGLPTFLLWSTWLSYGLCPLCHSIWKTATMLI